MKKKNLVLSPLGHTWIFDLDGTLVKHNGYLTDGRDTLLDSAAEFLSNIPANDKIIILTARTDSDKEATVGFLKDNGIRYDDIIFNAPYGERIIFNDRKPSGLQTAVAINVNRDLFPDIKIKIDDEL